MQDSPEGLTIEKLEWPWVHVWPIRDSAGKSHPRSNIRVSSTWVVSGGCHFTNPHQMLQTCNGDCQIDFKDLRMNSFGWIIYPVFNGIPFNPRYINFNMNGIIYWKIRSVSMMNLFWINPRTTQNRSPVLNAFFTSLLFPKFYLCPSQVHIPIFSANQHCGIVPASCPPLFHGYITGFLSHVLRAYVTTKAHYAERENMMGCGESDDDSSKKTSCPNGLGR